MTEPGPGVPDAEPDASGLDRSGSGREPAGTTPDDEPGASPEYSSGSYRVLPGRDDDEWLLLDVQSADPTYVPRDALPDVEAGNRVDADLSWSADDGPVVDDASVVSRTRFRFLRTSEAVFEAARTCFETARAEGEAMNARVTFDTDGDANGVVYTFADRPTADLFSAFRDGRKPLEPLVARALDGGAEPPVSVWTLDPEEPFVLVYIVLDPDGLLERTMRETYLLAES